MTRSTRKLEGNEKKDETVVISAGKRMLTSQEGNLGSRDLLFVMDCLLSGCFRWKTKRKPQKPCIIRKS